MDSTAITYDPVTRDYALHLAGDLVGYARSAHEGRIVLDQLVFNQLQHDSSADTPPLTSADLWALRCISRAAFYDELASYSDAQLIAASAAFAIYAHDQLGLTALTAAQILACWRRRLAEQVDVSSNL